MWATRETLVPTPTTTTEAVPCALQGSKRTCGREGDDQRKEAWTKTGKAISTEVGKQYLAETLGGLTLEKFKIFSSQGTYFTLKALSFFVRPL